MTASGLCQAYSGRGAPVTAYDDHRRPALFITRRTGDFICTQDPGHKGGHAACDGLGHILARWPRAAVEVYWQPGDCDGCDHCQGHGCRHRRDQQEKPS